MHKPSMDTFSQPQRVEEQTESDAERCCLGLLASQVDTFFGVINHHAAVSVHV